MKVYISKNCGFCSGVRKAVETALHVPTENTYILGELIHNEDVNARIRDRGIPTVETLQDVSDGARLLIRSHGVPKAVYARCKVRGIEVIDCTCKFVANTQRIVERESRAGKTIAITGHREHPEVVGLIGWCEGEVYVFSSEEDDFTCLSGKNVVLLSQTTFSTQRFSKIAEKIKKVCPKTVEIFETICYTTVRRQKETESLMRSS